ncbi:M48 metallopeptidase family protein [Sorangium sp. So ce128]|uniref:M48 metallopeptidase family protein n=1 Tax=Sorangium sp. So ce128 TaxID=3133281 RepID=UPI003F61549A
MKSSLYPTQELRRRALAEAVKLRVNPRVIRVQDMRRKWGSCSSAGTVTLASDLVDQDPHFQDFVIAHELLHLRVPTHGRLFKALMSAHVPGWRELEEQRVLPRTEIARRRNGTRHATREARQ